MERACTTTPADTRPPPKDLSHHISRTTRAREASSVKQFYKYFLLPGIGQLAGGLPNEYYFPFDTLEAKVARPDRWQPTPNRPVDPPPDHATLAALSVSAPKPKARSSPLNQPQDALLVPHTSKEENPTKKIDVATALQYSTVQGYTPLYYFVREFTQKHLHPNCPYQGGPEVALSCGNTDGFSKVLTALMNEWSEEKDWIRDREGLLVEKFTFTLGPAGAKPKGLNVVPVEIDDEGMVTEGPGGLEDVLENWDFNRGKRPHVMYTITMGQNPTSGVLSLQRRQAIYDLCCKYDIIIVEDDPYWYLQYPTSTAMNTTTTSDSANVSFNPEVEMFANAEPRPKGWKSSGYEFLDSIVPSSISIDTEGRVIRLDTFSKTIAPGCRLGWITAQPRFIERILRVAEASSASPSGFVQGMVAELLLGSGHSGLHDKQLKPNVRNSKDALKEGEGWKADGWVRWLEGLRGNYERRMTNMCRALESGKYLVKAGRRYSLASEAEDEWSVVEKTQMYSFTWPVGGMFLWLKIEFENHPLYSTFKKEGVDGLAKFARGLWLFLIKKPYLVLLSPGSMFSATDEIRAQEGWKYFRLCFAAADDDLVTPISQRVAEGIAGFWRIKDRKVIDKLLKEEEEDDRAVTPDEGLAQMIGPC